MEITKIYSHRKKIRQINYLVISIWQNVTFTKFLPKKGVEITEIYSHRKKIPSNQLLSDFYSKCYFHEIFVKKRVMIESKFP